MLSNRVETNLRSDPRFIHHSIFKFSIDKNLEFDKLLNDLQTQCGKLLHVNPNIKQTNFNNAINELEYGIEYEIHSYFVTDPIHFYDSVQFINQQNGIMINPQIGYFIWKLDKQDALKAIWGKKLLFPDQGKVLFICERSLWFDGLYKWYKIIEKHPGNYTKITLQSIETKIQNSYILYLKKI